MAYLDKIQVGSTTYDIRDSYAYHTDAIGPAAAPSTDYGLGGVLMPSVGVAIEPVQDLHGYDNPWPAGGGKNLLPKKSYQQSSSRLDIGTDDGSYRQYAAGTYTISYTADETASIYYQKDGSSSISLGSGYSKSVTLEDGGYRFWLYRSSGLPDNIDNWQLELGSTATAYAPYSNVCPISGHTSVSVVRTGKNLLPNIKAQNGDAVVIIGQTEKPTTNFKIFLSAGTYVLSTVTGKAARVYYRNSHGNSENTSSVQNPSMTFTVTTPDYYSFWLYNSGGFSESDVSSFQLELGSTATTYAPYQGTTITTAIPTPPGTVYGGTLDLVSGVLVVDKGITTINSISYVTASNKARATIDGMKTPNARVICDRFKTVSSSDEIATCYTINNSNPYLYFNQPYSGANFSTTDAWSDWFEENPTTVVYELATPVTYQLTPQQITALAGTNVLMSAAGQITATVPIDLKAYVDARLAEVQALILENT